MKKLFLIFGMIFVMLLAACTSGGENTSSTKDNSGENASNEDEGPTQISIMSHFFGPTPPSKDNPVEQEIEKATNTELDVQWNSAQNYLDKFNVALASEDLPDLILIPNSDPLTKNPVFRQAAEQGAFWDLAPYIDEYPNIKNGVAEIAWDLTKLNGSNYFIPRPRPTEGDSFFVLRKDWLDNVGLEEPTTSEELYEVMKAFTEEDPDQNGKDDTVGFTGYVSDTSMSDFGFFENFFTRVNGEWKDENGELIYTAFLPEVRDAIEYLAKAYKEGLIVQDFASLQLSQSNEIFSASKAGVKVEKTGNFQEYFDIITKNEPNFEFTNLYPVTNINGYNPKGPGFNGGNAIPKSVPEEKMKKILAMIDKWMADDVFNLTQQGIEGIHHTVENGEVVIDTEKMTKDGIGGYTQIVYVSEPYASTVKSTFPEEAQKLYAEVQDERAKTSVGPVSYGLYSETGEIYLPALRKDMTDLKTKIILGHEPITAWDNFIEELKNDPEMQKVTEEINEAFKNR